MVSHREAIELALKFDEVTDTALELESNEQKLRANDYIQDRGLLQRGAVDNPKNGSCGSQNGASD